MEVELIPVRHNNPAFRTCTGSTVALELPLEHNVGGNAMVYDSIIEGIIPD